MKYLVLLLIVLGDIWWIRQQRKLDQPAPPPSGTQSMLPCVHCGTHVPEGDAVKGKLGIYCSQTHRQTHEG